MVEWHGKSVRKASGGLRRSVNARDKYLSERGGDISNTTIAVEEHPAKVKSIRTRGNNTKSMALRLQNANVTDPKTNKTTQMEIITVKENIANRQFSRKNILTKNAIIEVKHGAHTALAHVTSRPGQSGAASAVLLTDVQSKAFLDRTAKAPSEQKTKAFAAKKQNKEREQKAREDHAAAKQTDGKPKKTKHHAENKKA